ncbi:MAG TPA: hypothetical protein VKG02_17185, partial [Blastocatellia bacterium]|nr:hypothetical protein [Blastocatellia bacterium]
HQFLREAPIVELPDGSAPARYGFIHSLYQNVLYQSMAEARRSRLHLMMGEQGGGAATPPTPPTQEDSQRRRSTAGSFYHRFNEPFHS